MVGFEIMVFLLVFGSILFLAYVTTRYIGNKSGRTLKGKYIHVIESVSIGLDKQLHLIEVAGQYVLISSSGKNIEFLTKVELKESQLELANESTGAINFSSVLDKYLPGLKQGKKREEAVESDFKEAGYNGHSAAFNNNLGKLKNITKKVERVTGNNGNEDADES